MASAIRRVDKTRFQPPKRDQAREAQMQLGTAFDAEKPPRLGRLPFGFSREKGSVIASKKHWAAARWLVVQLLADELNCSRTLAKLPSDFPWTPSRRGLMLWFQNPMLRGGIGRRPHRGTRRYSWVEWGRTPVLISPDEWQVALKLLDQCKRGARRTGKVGPAHLLSGLIRCEGCGKKLRWHSNQGANPTARYACTQQGCRFSGRGLREDRVRAAIIEKLCARARLRMAEKAWEGGAISGGWSTTIEPPELLKMRAQREQLEALREQGIPKLGPAICWLTDQMLPLQAWPGDEMWLKQCYGALLRDPGTLEAASNDLLRPVFLWFVLEVVYQGSPDQFVVRLG